MARLVCTFTPALRPAPSIPARPPDCFLTLAWLPPFDGVRLDDTTRTTLTLWRGLYATAASGRVAGADTLPGLL